VRSSLHAAQAIPRRLIPPARPGVGNRRCRTGGTPCAAGTMAPARDRATGPRSGSPGGGTTSATPRATARHRVPRSVHRPELAVALLARISSPGMSTRPRSLAGPPMTLGNMRHPPARRGLGRISGAAKADAGRSALEAHQRRFLGLPPAEATKAAQRVSAATL
jgi:hypothetical protein